jgi:hypothetical protein
MGKAVRFISGFAIGFFLVSLCSLGLWLIHASPLRTNAAIARVSLGPDTNAVHLLGSAFACTHESSTDRCSIWLQGQPLEVAVNYANVAQAPQPVARCQASFAGQAVDCSASFEDTSTKPSVWILHGLNLDQSNLQELRRTHFFAQLQNKDWMHLVVAIAIATGLITATILWLYPAQAKVIAYTSGSLAVVGLLLGFAGVSIAAICIALFSLVLLWCVDPDFEIPLKLKLIASISIGTVVFALSWYMLYSSLVALGFFSGTAIG